MKKTRFATVFANMANIHITKDPGMIPFVMSNFYDFDVTVPLSKQCEYPDADSYFKGIDTPLINDSKLSSRNLNRFFWIKKNAKNIEVLNLYFFDRWTFFDLWIYLRKNKTGLVYVHTDSDGERLKSYKFDKNIISKLVFKKLLLTDSNLDKVLWGVQNKAAVELLKTRWPFKNIMYVPDGFYWEENIFKPYDEKENIILTIARNGTAQKRTDILLEGWAQIADQFQDWKLRLVGSVEENFKPYLNDYFLTHPELMPRIEFVGPVKERSLIEKEYANAKVFCLTSDWESFGIVTAEAMSKGCYVIGSDIPATSELLDNGKLGSLFRTGDTNDFANKLQEALSNETYMKLVSERASDTANEKYSWKGILAPVNDWISKKRKEIC